MYLRFVAFVALAWICACGQGGHGHDHDGDHAHDHGHDHEGASNASTGHSHDPQHGGVLVALGDEYAHFEMLLEPETGAVQVWLYDREVSPVRSSLTELELKLSDGATVALAARANALTGETVGDASSFEGQAEELVGRSELDGSVLRIEVLGETFTNVPVRWAASE